MYRFISSIALAGLTSAVASGQPTSLTYQGQLKQAGAPLSDLVDMRFTLYDSESAKKPIAGPIAFDGLTFAPVEVVSGLFTVELDFGSDAFQQGGEWLQVAVRAPHDPTDTGAYTLLTPWQHLTAAPFALSVPGLATTETGVEVEGDIHTPGEVIASAFSSNSPLIFKVNPSNTECARFKDTNCYLGLGTIDPQARLHIGGTPGVDGIRFPDGSLQTSAAGIGGGDGFWSPSGANIFNNNGGNVGIGTSSVVSRLTVGGAGVFNDPSAAAITLHNTTAGRRWEWHALDNGWLQLADFTAGVTRMLFDLNGNVSIGSAGAQVVLPGGANPTNDGTVFNYSGDGRNYLRGTTVLADTGGNVGIGTPNPGFKLSVESSGYGLVHSSGPIQVGTYTGFGGGWLGTRSDHPLYFFTGDSLQQLTLSTAGRLGIGHTDPVRRLHVRGDSIFAARFESEFATATVTEFTNAASNNTWEYAVTGSAPPFGLGAGDMYLYRQGNGVPGLSISRDNFTAKLGCADFFMGHPSRRGAPGRALVDFGDHLVINFGTDWGYTFVHGRLKVGVLEIFGADVAERFATKEDKVEPGTVMEIDPDNAGELRTAREAYSTRVAGVVSGAGDIPTGTILGNLPGSEEAPPIALSGRVWVQCDAATSSIAPGDLLTTSATPGHAMKAADRERSHGAVLGKAMSSLAQGERGLVLVLVNLQ